MGFTVIVLDTILDTIQRWVNIPPKKPTTFYIDSVMDFGSQTNINASYNLSYMNRLIIKK